ncbi:flagellar hook-basal body complex protein [Bacillota bacterium LX-D]|nr:flagellar hook-basal body complex protein [Bacillota bacterium LX-D]
MMRSLYSAVAGLRTHQTRMDVIGDNIANVNTYGFKKSRTTFQDMFYQTLQGGSAAEDGDARGGTNSSQVGLGVTLATIDGIHTQGAAAPTGKESDLMIQGDGFFILHEEGTDGATYYTRNGNFSLDNNGDLVNTANGLYVTDTDGNKINVPTTSKSFSISKKGEVIITQADGTIADNPQIIAIAKFPNPAGLQKVGQNMYVYDTSAGNEAGDPTGGSTNNVGGAPGLEGRGIILSGSLEMSNVELAQEFTDLITTQRGFQANAKTITTSDQMLEELLNIKR